MARVKFSVLLSEVNGSVGSATFQRSRGGSILRNKPLPTKTRSVSQLNARQIMNSVQQAWSGLTLAQQNQWTSFNSFVPSYQKNNQNFIISGFALFLKYNLIRMHAGFSILTSFEYTSLAPLILDPVVTLAGGALTLGLQEDISDDVSYVLFKASPVKNNITFSFKKRLRVILLPYTGPAGQSSWDISSDYVSLFGKLPVATEQILISIIHFSMVAPIIGKTELYINTVTGS